MKIADVVGSEGEPSDLIVNSCEPSTNVPPNIVAITLRDNSVRAHRAEKERNVCLAEYIAI